VNGSGLPWWKSGVVYQIAVPSFADSNGDGIGDLRGIIGRLDYLNDGTPDSLGIDAIWLTPIAETDFADFGYDVTDYRAIDPRFGTMDDLADLLDACHRRDIRVMHDFVLNHTSIEHPWFAESRSSRDNPKRDWYVWRDGRAPGKPPNRWRSVVEGSTWEFDDATNQYYYHAFLPFQPDLNWRNPEVEAEMFDIARFWLDKGVDGFRLDLVNFLVEDEQLRDNPRRLGARPYEWQHHRYDRSQPESVEIAKRLRRLADGYPGRALMGEVYTDRPEDAIGLLGDGGDGLHLAFYLDFTGRPWSAAGYRASVAWLEEHCPPGGWPCYYLNNHDLPRTYGRLGGSLHAEAKAKLTAAMLLTLRGTPIVYYGEEIGMPPARVSRGATKDPLARKFWPLPLGRDGSRTPMQWDGSPNAGFTTGEPWLPVDASAERVNVERESAEPDSLLSWYRALVHLRARTPALHAGDYRAIEDVPRGVFAYARAFEGSEVVVALNFTPREVELGSAAFGASGTDGPDDAEGVVLLSTHRDAGAPVAMADVTLAAYEALVVARSGGEYDEGGKAATDAPEGEPPEGGESDATL
jgi:alpha-glucosidase